MCAFSNRARFSQPVWRKSGKRIARTVLGAAFIACLIALVWAGIANLAGMASDAVPPISAGYESKTESAPFYERAYFPRASVNQGAGTSETYIPVPTLTSTG